MRLAGSPEIYEALAKHFVSDDVPRPAAEHMAAEVMVHGDDADIRIDEFMRYYGMYKDKGFSDQAAQHLAVEALEGEGDPPAMTRRFAGTYED
jgi:hypothetical protein